MARESLGVALASIARQSHPDLEVVLVGACGPAHPVPATQCGSHPVRFVDCTMQLRRAEAANAGLAAAAGQWITFLDDDDLLLEGHVSGLVAAIDSASGARLIHSLARAQFANGSFQAFGQPCSMIQLHERNFIHLSTALFARSLVSEGCRFDTTFDIHEDWEFCLQCAQRTRLHFTRQMTFVWNADAGDSGGGGGRNHHAARFAEARDRVYAKWAAEHESLVSRVQSLLQTAVARAAQRNFADAARACDEALEASPDDPWVFNVMAMLERAQGHLSDALAAQHKAVIRRPDDPDIVYNLALLCRDAGDLVAAREHCEKALALVPDNPRYRGLARALA